jgi:hypothetical protein
MARFGQTATIISAARITMLSLLPDRTTDVVVSAIVREIGSAAGIGLQCVRACVRTYIGGGWLV